MKRLVTVVLVAVMALTLFAGPASAAKYNYKNWDYWGRGTVVTSSGWQTTYAWTKYRGRPGTSMDDVRVYFQRRRGMPSTATRRATCWTVRYSSGPLVGIDWRGYEYHYGVRCY